VTDLPTAITEIAAGRLTIRQYLVSMSGNLGFAVLSLRDPLPFIADIVLAPTNYFRGRGF
ncbi:MAG TPA: ATP-grasp domain-containing protein, partial [Anaerolineae bacterium]|nr:ATP-grasp domain-containing protein [Anaerolineae bacterium]